MKLASSDRPDFAVLVPRRCGACTEGLDLQVVVVNYIMESHLSEKPTHLRGVVQYREGMHAFRVFLQFHPLAVQGLKRGLKRTREEQPQECSEQ